MPASCQSPRVSGDLSISDFLAAVRQDRDDSRGCFPRNAYPVHPWPIPFFGNPRTAVLATVGVNPSSGEFRTGRNWSGVRTSAEWKRRLRDYFKLRTPPHRWFEPWRTGLSVLGLSYEDGTAAHLDVSYRSTRAMLQNSRTDRLEFRRMVERDVQWFFRLLPLCPNLRGLLVFGPIIRDARSCESLADFVRKSAPRHGFNLSQNDGSQIFTTGGAGRALFIHEVFTPGEKCVTCAVVKNLLLNRDGLRRRIPAPA
jgi:hypothetical protein